MILEITDFHFSTIKSKHNDFSYFLKWLRILQNLKPWENTQIQKTTKIINLVCKRSKNRKHLDNLDDFNKNKYFEIDPIVEAFIDVKEIERFMNYYNILDSSNSPNRFISQIFAKFSFNLGNFISTFETFNLSNIWIQLL